MEGSKGLSDLVVQCFSKVEYLPPNTNFIDNSDIRFAS